MKSLMIKTSIEAGKLLMKNFGKIKTVRAKDKKSYVTNVDLESDKLIISAIRKKYPDHNIISEESGEINNNSEYTWYIDPIDGTHNYIKNIPLFGISIALTHKKELKLGAINLPYLKELYVAEKGKGAYLNGKRLRVSNKNNLKNSFIVMDLSIRYVPKKVMGIFDRLKTRVYDIRAFGCAVYEYAIIANGIADGYITAYTNSWDAAAGVLIVEEANGKVTDFDGNAWSPEQNKFVSTNKKIHGKLLKLVK